MKRSQTLRCWWLLCESVKVRVYVCVQDIFMNFVWFCRSIKFSLLLIFLPFLCHTIYSYLVLSQGFGRADLFCSFCYFFDFEFDVSFHLRTISSPFGYSENVQMWRMTFWLKYIFSSWKNRRIFRRNALDESGVVVTAVAMKWKRYWNSCIHSSFMHFVISKSYYKHSKNTTECASTKVANRH